MYTRATVGSTPLDDFVKVIPGIYAEPDKKRSIWDVWLHANHHASAIGEEVRKNKPGGKLLQEIADFSMWLFTFLGKVAGTYGEDQRGSESPQESLIRVRLSFSDMLWYKYPAMCPVCYWRRSGGGDRDRETSKFFRNSCDCLLYDVESRNQDEKRKHVVALRGFAEDGGAEKPTSVDDFQKLFTSIFSPNLRHLDLDDIAFHLLEELGEVSDAMVRTYTYSGKVEQGEPSWRQVWLEEEIADVTSWLFALVEKLNLVIETADEYDAWRSGEPSPGRERFTLSQIIWKRYGSDALKAFYCPHGPSQLECSCPIVIFPYDVSLDELRAAFSPPS